jgi:hypothetical protein
MILPIVCGAQAGKGPSIGTGICSRAGDDRAELAAAASALLS